MMTIPENNLSFAVAFNGFGKLLKLSRLRRMHLFWVDQIMQQNVDNL